MKKAISYYMPRKAMDWDEVHYIGNPTKSAAVNSMIKATGLHDLQGSGKKSAARRAFEWEEFIMVLLATRQLFTAKVMSTLLAVMSLQWQVIGHIDDMMNLATGTVLKHEPYPFVLNIKMCWSKNIQSEQQSATQILFAAMDPVVCPILHLGIFIETVVGNTNQNISGLLNKIFSSIFFKPVLEGGLLGTPSIRKGAATFANCRGITRD